MMDNASIINNFIARFFPQKPSSQYTATIDVSAAVRGETSGAYKESQSNKPSPVSQFTYSGVLRLFSWTLLKKNHVLRSYAGWTNSMEPTLDSGDLILRTPYAEYKKRKGSLRLGQIAIYRYGQTRIIHRFIGTLPDGRLVFKGDNNFRADPPVPESSVEDVMIGVVYTWDKVSENQD